ncbi:putative lpqU [Mycobacterium avium subsp. avium 2285 (R)]|nr:putative lpqU [Mycobacterium avium subsp. avium 2285 (R)]
MEIPVIALEAYAYAARVAEVENPKCHIAWTTLAGIGQVESHHGTYRGARLAPNGDVSPRFGVSAWTAAAARCASSTTTRTSRTRTA